MITEPCLVGCSNLRGLNNGNEEEARFAPDMMGSMVNHGHFPLADMLELIGIDGARVADALADIGYAGEGEFGGTQMATAGAISMHPKLVNATTRSATLTVDLRNTD